MDEQNIQQSTGLHQEGQTTPPTGVSAASGGKDATPAVTLTQADIDKAVHSALTKAGRETKAIEEARKAIETKQAEISEWQKQREADELEKIKDNPQALTAYQKEQALKKKEVEIAQRIKELEAKETTFAERLSKVEQLERKEMLTTIATELKVDAEMLTKAVDAVGLTDPDKIKTLAKTIWNKPVETKNPLVNGSVFKGGNSGGTGTDYATVKFGANAPSAGEMIKAGLNKK